MENFMTAEILYPTEQNNTQSVGDETAASILYGEDGGRHDTGDTQPAGDNSTQEKEDYHGKEGTLDFYEPFNIPEGVEMNQEHFNEISELANSYGLTQQQTQAGVDYFFNVQDRLMEMENHAFEQERTQWIDTVKTDREIGGENLDSKLGIAKQAMDRFSPPALDKNGKPLVSPHGKPYVDERGRPWSQLHVLSEELGIGDHPEFIRFLYRVGKGISEDGYVSGSRTGNQAKSPAEILYPNEKGNTY